MKFGLFYELIALRPHDEEAVRNAYWQALEQIQYAEQMGFEYVWETEHHFTEKFSYSSAPELFLTATAARTSKIRLGHGVVLLTMNHPVRAAERAAVLDLPSNGRLEFGPGRGPSEAELGFPARLGEQPRCCPPVATWANRSFPFLPRPIRCIHPGQPPLPESPLRQPQAGALVPHPISLSPCTSRRKSATNESRPPIERRSKSYTRIRPAMARSIALRPPARLPPPVPPRGPGCDCKPSLYARPAEDCEPSPRPSGRVR